MKIGLLWFDNSPTDALSVKINRAAAYYAQKTGEIPNACYTNPANCPAETVIDQIAVIPTRHILPHHFWIGVEEASCCWPPSGSGCC